MPSDSPILDRLPTGNGRIPRTLREINERLARLAPRRAPGVLTSVTTTGAVQRPNPLTSGTPKAGTNATPRYR